MNRLATAVGALLRWLTTLLPPSHRDWGEAVHAEAADIPPGWPRLRWYAGQRNLCDLDLSRNGSRYGYVLDLPQSRTETLLRARVQELGGAIEQRVELVRLAQRAAAPSTPHSATPPAGRSR